MHDPSPRPTPPPGPPWSGPPWSPPPRRGPSWPTALIVAAVIIAGAAIAVAAITTRSHPAAGGPPASANSATPSPTVDTADSSTCRAGRSTSEALEQVDNPLPDQWDWDTTGIDGLIAKSNAVVTKVIDLFEPQIAAQPADEAAAAHAYVQGRRTEVAKLANHTYTEADGVSANTALATLDQLCHVTDHK